MNVNRYGKVTWISTIIK